MNSKGLPEDPYNVIITGVAGAGRRDSFPGFSAMFP